MTNSQIIALMKTPLSEVKKQTLDELSEYKEEIEEIGLMETVDKINSEFNKHSEMLTNKVVAYPPDQCDALKQVVKKRRNRPKNKNLLSSLE